MKTLRTLAVLFTVFLFLGQTALYAETIYKKDGTVIQAKITGKTEDTIWYELTTEGDIIEEVGIDVSEVEKILNDDGTVSRYSPTYIAPPAQKK